MGSSVMHRERRLASNDATSRLSMKRPQLLGVVMAVEEHEVQRQAVKVGGLHGLRRLVNTAMAGLQDRHGADIHRIDHGVRLIPDRRQEVARRITGQAPELRDPPGAGHPADCEEQQRLIILNESPDFLAGILD